MSHEKLNLPIKNAAKILREIYEKKRKDVRSSEKLIKIFNEQKENESNKIVPVKKIAKDLDL